jgi:hypothetical protein
MNTKTYPIVQADENLYAIGPKGNKWLNQGWCYDSNLKKLFKHEFRDELNIIQSAFSEKILFTTDKSLGLPLLPPIEEDVEQLFENKYELKPYNKPGSPFRYFSEGYKANKGKWSDEDMQDCWIKAHENAGKLFNKEPHILFGKYLKEKKDSLKKVPIAVEVGMDVKYLDRPQFEWIPKIENNYVKIVKWIYE